MAWNSRLVSSDFTRAYYPTIPPLGGRPLTAVPGGGYHPQPNRPGTAIPGAVNPGLWREGYRAKIGSAKSVVSLSKSIELENKRLCDETRCITESRKEAVEKRLEKRCAEIKYWRSEVDARLDQLHEDVTRLKVLTSRINKQHDLYQHPLEVSEKCLKLRQSREEPERVGDEAWAALQAEVRDLETCRAAMTRAARDARTQARHNLAVIYHLKKDFLSKSTALHVDTQTRELMSSEPAANILPEEVIVASPVSVGEWQELCQGLVKRADQQHSHSDRVFNSGEAVLSTSCRVARDSISRTNAALHRRIQDTRRAKGELEEQHGKVVEEQQCLDRSLSELEAQLRLKREPFAVALTRMRTRSAKPVKEQTRDYAESALYREITDLEKTIRRLQDAALATRGAVKRLAAARVALEEDVNRKAQALYVDEVKVMDLRNTVDVDLF